MAAKRGAAADMPIARPVREVPSEPILEERALDYEPVEQTPEEIPAASAPKLPDNYMQSKFMIATAGDAIESASGAGRDVRNAGDALAQARAAFDKAEYGKALSLALRARKLAEGLPVTGPSDDGMAPVTDIGALSGAASESRAQNVSRTVAADATLNCPDCEAHVEEDDAFCRKCGGKLEFALACPGCGKELDEGDAFCRKCGTKVA
jgi:hypothetical protein